jgi:hypothetical protein
MDSPFVPEKPGWEEAVAERKYKLATDPRLGDFIYHVWDHEVGIWRYYASEEDAVECERQRRSKVVVTHKPKRRFSLERPTLQRYDGRGRPPNGPGEVEFADYSTVPTVPVRVLSNEALNLSYDPDAYLDLELLRVQPLVLSDLPNSESVAAVSVDTFDVTD